MRNNKVNPEETREKLRQEELKNPSSSVQGSNLSDLVGGFSWKATGILLLVIVLGFIVYAVFFR
ncbi:DUF6366 family protein [Ornithinibacillus halotolerans]|uniref:Phage capsid protein n=1 Tax=Ornithinibacillus halotolerans TaxID=1274357 RepID=A0A916RKU2_9BACI|nr:DUF6366 family protein [Ornithinibacillus halotolerans]GGA60142.1 hypothetical protein GCM10008025_00210 [Ornithinibacillus halotolerans]